MFAIHKKELETLIQTIRIYSQDIGMVFGKEKYAMLIIKNGRRQLTEGIELPNQERIRMFGEKETYNYLGILEVDDIKQAEMKGKNKKEHFRRTKTILEAKLSYRNLIKGINTWAILVRCSGLFLKRTMEERRQIDQRIRKLMQMHKGLQQGHDIDRQEKKEEEESPELKIT